MKHLLGLLNISERHKKAQMQAYLKVSKDKKHQLHENVGREVNSRLKRGTEWMNKASKTISLYYNVASVRTGKSWVLVKDDRFT